jgi:hypothetical protein
MKSQQVATKVVAFSFTEQLWLSAGNANVLVEHTVSRKLKRK